jgi:hypothetical protein
MFVKQFMSSKTFVALKSAKDFFEGVFRVIEQTTCKTPFCPN